MPTPMRTSDPVDGRPRDEVLTRGALAGTVPGDTGLAASATVVHLRASLDTILTTVARRADAGGTA